MHDKRHMPSARGFTLIEMLTVIAIIGIIAGLSLPVLKNFGKSDINVSASRQLLDDVGYARQLAMAQHTTVYMVFVPTNFWISASGNNLFSSTLNASQLSVATNLLARQLTGYTYMAYGAVGDQPGNHQWHYLAPWQNLPNGAFIPMWKFYNPNATPGPPYVSFSDPVNNTYYFDINQFSTNAFPFPTQDSTNLGTGYSFSLPYIAFNYLGQLCDSSGNLLVPQSSIGIGDSDFSGGGIDIPIEQGSVLPNINANTKALQPGPPQVTEVTIGNSTNISYTVVHIDPLTGRSTLLYHKMQ